MFTKYDKAGAGVLGAAAGSVLAHFLGLDAEVAAAVTLVLTGGLTWLVPNRVA